MMMVTSCKAKRSSHSTCHAETNAGYKVNQNSQFVGMRFTELIHCGENQHSAKQMMEFYDRSNYEIPTDHHTDCMDFY